MFAGTRGADRSGLIRQAARLIVEEALEAEAAQELGRDYYAHGAEGRGYRNGYRTGKVKTAESVIEFAVCEIISVSRGGYYNWLDRRPSSSCTMQIAKLMAP